MSDPKLVARVKAMKDRGYSTIAIARAFKLTETQVRSLLKSH